MNIPFREAVRAGGLVGDGAMGSLLYERGVFVNRNFDQVNLSEAELVYKVHRDYLLAGAHVLETNTYGANRIRLARHGLEDKLGEINQAAIDILRRAAEGLAYLAGSIGPTGLAAGELRRAEKDIRAAYAEQARILTDGGCDLLLIETFHDPAELRLAVEGARAAVAIPIVAQISVDDTGRIADGSDPAELARELHDWGADVVGANCNGPEVIYQVTAKMVSAGFPVSAYPNAGRPHRIEDRFIYLATPENFGVFARRMYKAGVALVGGCCGTGPTHIERVAAAARMVAPRTTLPSQAIELLETRPPPKPVAERSSFGAQLGRRFLVSVEVNPDPGLTIDKPLAAARMLFDSGADIINIADGPRATARMSNLALGLRIQEQLGREVLLHLCTRDRNLLGLQAFALGAHVLGIRNLVVITGDPPKIGDYPDATAVYDLDSIGLLRMLDGLNRGVDPAGRSLGGQTSFVLATGAEPAAGDFEREMLRLGQKIEAGANLVMTQPLYDPALLDRFLDAIARFEVPILVGLVPLASYRNAEFLHTSVPMMRVPEDVRERMRKAGSGEAARKEGVAIAVETLLAVRDRVAGAYIMPPLGRYEMGAAIIEALGADRGLGPKVVGRAREA